MEASIEAVTQRCRPRGSLFRESPPIRPVGPRQVPQGGIVRLIAEVRPELIVVVVLDAGTRKVAVEHLVDFVRHVRTTVEQQHFDLGVVADALGPNLENPLGVVTRISVTPLVNTSSRPVLSK